MELKNLRDIMWLKAREYTRSVIIRVVQEFASKPYMKVDHDRVAELDSHMQELAARELTWPELASSTFSVDRVLSYKDIPLKLTIGSGGFQIALSFPIVKTYVVKPGSGYDTKPYWRPYEEIFTSDTTVRVYNNTDALYDLLDKAHQRWIKKQTRAEEAYKKHPEMLKVVEARCREYEKSEEEYARKNH